MSEKYLDSSLPPEERARALLDEMSLDEKMAQINCLFPFGDSRNDWKFIGLETSNGIGQVSTLEMRRIESLEQVGEWQRKVQEIVMKNSPHSIPAIFHMEGLCGPFIQDSTSFPSGIGRGASWDPDLEEEIAEIVSRQEAACGITHVFAPVLDISRDSRMGRQGETYGEDPVLASAMGVAYTRGIQKHSTDGRKTESVAKHFLAFHNSQGGIHGTASDTPERLLQEVYGKPFQAVITEAALKGIMPCYSLINGEAPTASRGLLTKLLRQDMGFEGVCVSDYGAISNVHNVQGIGESMESVGLQCLAAGMDVELPSPTGYSQGLKALFGSGDADIGFLDEAVLRVLTSKFRMGLFEHPFALSGQALKEEFSHVRDQSVSLQSAQESIVLIKNNGVLPLNTESKTIAVIGPHAANAGKFFGGYTHLCITESIHAIANSIAGVSGIENIDNQEIVTLPGTNIQSDETEEIESIRRLQKPDCRSLLEELRGRLPDTKILYSYGYPVAGDDQSSFQSALEIAQKADVVILTLGGKHGTCSLASMGEGVDSSNINLPRCQDEFIKLVAQLKKPLVGVHFDGRPISSDMADNALDAIVEAWNPAEKGAEAVVSVLVGTFNPGGKMPVSTARTSGQIPIYYNHPNGSSWHQSGSIGFANYVDLPHTPRYYFGHGLSYTSFSYSGLEIETMEVLPTETVRIAVNIQNTGEREGDEVVQLYLRDVHASLARPVKELAGFRRVTLSPGETKHIVFEVEASQMAFLDEEMKWKIEKGKVEVEVGSSSEDIRLKGAFTIKDDAWIQGKNRAFYAKVSVQ